MQRFEVRPRFELELTVPPEVLAEAFRAAVANDTESWSRMPYVEFGVPAKERRTWSPRLAVCVHEPEAPDLPFRLHCRYQPEPAVWTFYMAIGAALLVSGCAAIAWICASWILGWSVLVPVSSLGLVSVLGAGLYAASAMGRRMAAEQMSGLADRLWFAVCDARARARGEPPLTVDLARSAEHS